MTDLNLTCAIDADDQICATRSSGGKRIEFTAWADGKQHGVEVYADTDKARTFARGILALADEIDGGEVTAKPEPARRPQVGDRVRVVADDPTCMAGKFVGLTGTLAGLGGTVTPFKVKFGPGRHGDLNGYWYCAEVELVHEPDTELAADESSFSSHVERAKTLLAGTTHNGADVIRLAEILADRA
ncbi:hypothetical protein PV332_10675 [Streptomyces scabiei]|uniref:hypothetical protein n=1 Tax=Streptomyces scabiei TaxID=1930 RepID=UPI0029BF304F|nr:hypothetical protein [Streptomyces scabiei]MDX2575945.1 hypothetical protein [Streptomyces scabiei]MDX2885582.1 hypothetical protein [Streptomyces scabiei]MDX2993465.1 hypothetical protein [Streptomyces scabiei]MDX3028421.1 hypothetical protein [Streptomyces scabiei]MDX3047245.1 hypothetical protein [Streptomyces scabiei]